MIFKTETLSKQSVVQKFLKKLPPENAVKEIANKLADTDLMKVTVEDIQGIIHRYKINFKKILKPQLQNLYRKYLSYCLIDKEISDDEIEKLKHLKNLFMLSDSEVKEIQDITVSEIYKSEVENAISDGRLDENEKQFLEDLKKKLRLDDKNAEQIYALSAQTMLSNLFNHAINDQRLSPDEEKELEAVSKSLGISLKIEGSTQAILDRYRLFWQIENGIYPVMNADINIQKGEHCHLAVKVDWLEQRRITQKINYAGPTMRIKIVKGVYWRAGSMAVQPVSKDVWQTIDSGILYLTNRRLIFMGSKGNKTIKLNKILDFNVFKNGVDIQKDSGKSPFLEFTENVDIFSLLLGQLIINE